MFMTKTYLLSQMAYVDDETIMKKEKCIFIAKTKIQRLGEVLFGAQLSVIIVKFIPDSHRLISIADY